MKQYLTNRVVGVRQIKKALNAGKLDRVIIASDADASVLDGLIALCERLAVDIERVPSKKELGLLCGIEVATAAVGINRAFREE